MRRGRSGSAIAAGAATTVVAVAWQVAFQAWVPNTSHRYDLAEPFVEPWTGLTWIGIVALWLATLAVGRVRLPLVAIGIVAVLLQALTSVQSVWVGIGDGLLTPPGTLMTALSVVQIGLTLAWMILIARWKRMPV
jgi:hypothetical protein